MSDQADWRVYTALALCAVIGALLALRVSSWPAWYYQPAVVAGLVAVAGIAIQEIRATRGVAA